MFPIRGDGFVIERPDDRTVRLTTYDGDVLRSVKEQELRIPDDERGKRFVEACLDYITALTGDDVETLMPSDLFPVALLDTPVEDFAAVLDLRRARQILFYLDPIPPTLLATIARPPAPVLTEPDLEARIVETDERDAFAVYGDWLTERGDPRGELIAVQLAREVADTPELAARQAELLHEYAYEWLATYAWRPEFTATWRRGFLHRIDAGEISLVGLYEIPHRMLLRELEVKSPDWATADIKRGYAHLAMLQRLRIEAQEIDLGAIDLPSLRDIELVTRGLLVDNLESLRAASWPQLRRFVLWLGEYDVDNCDVTLDDLDWILAGEGLGTVRELGLCGREPAQLLERIVAAPILTQLETLDLAGSFLDDASIQFVRDHTSAFAHLREVRFPPPLMRRDPSVVAEILPNGIVDDRFIPVYE